VTIDEILESSRDQNVYKIQLNEENSAEFLKRYPDLMKRIVCYYCVIGQGYRTVWGTKIQLHGFEPVPGRIYNV
jgi:hypothetical protein